MISTDELNAGLERVRDMQENGPPWHEFAEAEGIDPNAAIECAGDHAETLASFGVIDPRHRHLHAISFGSGFTLAMVVLAMQRENGNA